MKLDEIKKGTEVTYSLFKNITFEGMDEKHVILEDKSGNQKKIFKELFMKYGRVVK